jgi:hypothetical protein
MGIEPTSEAWEEQFIESLRGLPLPAAHPISWNLSGFRPGWFILH